MYEHMYVGQYAVIKCSCSHDIYSMYVHMYTSTYWLTGYLAIRLVLKNINSLTLNANISNMKMKLN